MLKFFDLFPELKDNLTDYKVHLATPSLTDPLNAFLQGNFKDWQERQTKKNFERKFIISFISYDIDEWLFVGTFISKGCQLVNDFYEYKTEPLDNHNDLIGRLIIKFKKNFRQSYPYLENCIDSFNISQVLKEKYSIKEFPGYEKTIIEFDFLQTIFMKNDPSWYTALKNVKGVYLITDKSTGKHYVGSAYGKYAFWSRWSQYADNGHGGDVELKKLIEENGITYAQNFQFSILEVRYSVADNSEIIEREQHWKRVLLSTEFGHNIT